MFYVEKAGAVDASELKAIAEKTVKAVDGVVKGIVLDLR